MGSPFVVATPGPLVRAFLMKSPTTIIVLLQITYPKSRDFQDYRMLFLTPRRIPRSPPIRKDAFGR